MSIDARNGCHSPDTLRSELEHLHDTLDMSWRQIAALAQYSPIPAGTLCSIAKGAKIPRKWLQRLNVRREDARKRIAISKTNAESAARSIRRNVSPEVVEQIKELL